MEHVKRINNERMRNIAEQEGNVVYEYQYDTPEKEADAAQVVKLAKAIVQERQKLSTQSPDLSDEDAACNIKSHSEAFDIFSRTHQRIFEMMCAKETNGESFAMLCKLAKFKRDTDQMGMSEAEASAKVSEYLMSQCARTQSDPTTL